MLLGFVVRCAAEAEHATSLPLDYLELKGDMLCAEDEAFVRLRNRLSATGLPLAAMTSPLPRRFGCRIVGPEADAESALSVFTRMCDRAASLGVRTVVFGSGQARSLPSRFPTTEGIRQLREFLVRAQRLCAERSIALTLEPLNSVETNLLNSCTEARPVVEDVGIQLAVDCFHIVSEKLHLDSELAAATGFIGHAHTSAIPRGGRDFRMDIQEAFVTGLLTGGYTGMLSIEDDFTADSVTALREYRSLIDSESR